MARSFGLVDEKLAEADFFLEHLAGAGFNLFEARCYFSAFVAAARSVTFSLQAVMANTDGFQDWYSAKQVSLKKCKRAKFFHTARTESQHIGISPIVSGLSHRNQDGTSDIRYYFCSPFIGQNDDVAPEEDVVTACKLYMTAIVEIIHDCYRCFGTVIDPVQYYTLENLQRLGLSLEDVEEDLGFPRGWTFVEPGHDKERLNMLRREIPASGIDWLFEKYLGETRLTT